VASAAVTSLQFQPPDADGQDTMEWLGMNRGKQLASVLAGYALALAASTLTVVLYDRGFSPSDNQSMGGMIAGGEMMLGAGVFGLLSLAPTGLALWYLRRSQRFWSMFSVAGIAFAIAGLAAVLGTLAAPAVMARVPALMFADLLGLGQMLGAPLWIGSFLLFAAIAPAGNSRRRMLVAAAIEAVIGACALVHFLVRSAPI
jgi:hypothetical protein